MASVSARSEGGASQAGRSFAPDRMDASFLRLGRMTPSVMRRVQYERGIDALFASFPKSDQLAIRQLCFEYLDVKHRRQLVLKRLGTESFPHGKPEVLLTIEQQAADAESLLRRKAGSAYGSLVAALEDPEIQEAMATSNPFTEEEEVEEGSQARVWRRRLANRSWKRVAKGYRSTTHDHPTRSGSRSIWQAINTYDDTQELSYYQKQQLKYGAGRRGSTAVAGSWEQIWGTDTAPKPAQATITSKEEPSVAAAAAAAAEAKALSGPDAQYITPGQHAASQAEWASSQPRPSPPQAPAGAPSSVSDEAIQALLDQASTVVSEYAAETGDSSVLQAPPPPPDTAALLQQADAVAASASSPPPPPASSSGAQAGPPPPRPVAAAASYRPATLSAAPDATEPVRRRESVGGMTQRTAAKSVGARSVGGASQAFTLSGDAANAILPVVRTTPSAAAKRAKSKGLEAVMARHGVREQHMIREMALDVAELLHRIETIESRLAEDPLYDEAVSEPPEVLGLLEDELAEAKERMYERLEPDEVSIILSSLSDADTRMEMGLVPESEEWAQSEGEDAARVWRRKILRMKHQKISRGRYTGMHDTITPDGGRDLWNELNTRDPDAGQSYYQKQQRKYGRGRRGSTAIAGAWAVFFAEQDAEAAEEAHRAELEVMGGARSSGGGGHTPQRSSGVTSAAAAPAPPLSPDALDEAAMAKLMEEAKAGNMDAIMDHVRQLMAEQQSGASPGKASP